MKAIRHISIISIILLIIGFHSYAQIPVPEQSDTLFIKSMTFHFESIRTENWPFSYVIRKPDAFIFGGKEFKILDSYSGIDKYRFTLSDGNVGSDLVFIPQQGTCILKFSGYELTCTSDKIFDNIGKPRLDSRASWPGMVKKDKADSKTNACVEGRNVLGTLPKPKYNVQESGTVVIRITVNPEGQVTSARYESNRSTVSSQKLIKAARNAAMNAKFTPKMNAPAIQEGTITYKFSLK